MKKIVYLFGTGATSAEMSNAGWSGNILMSHINQAVFDKSKKLLGNYAQLIEDLSIAPDDLDIEQAISLFEDLSETKNPMFVSLLEEVRKNFYLSILENLVNKKKYVPSNLSTTLLLLHKKYKENLGESGEELIGILTVNFDSVLENAFLKTYGGLNYGIQIKYENIKEDNSCVPLLKLHGSFNWRGINSLTVDPKFEYVLPDDESGWLRPSVFKKPELVYKDLWDKASKILLNCDVLRIIGCSLRIEDWTLISLIFQNQIQSEKKFGIELILPKQASYIIREKLKFLSKIKPIEEIYKTEFDMNNVYKSFVLKKLNEAMDKNSNVKDDAELLEVLR